MTQVISGHGCFGDYPGREESPRCHHCPEGVDSAEHTLLARSAWTLQMFSTRKKIQRGKDSERNNEKPAFTLNFLVHGSSVPIYSQQPKTLKKCKSCHGAPKEMKLKEFSFPLDKIIYLSERLKLTGLTEKEIKPISVSSGEPDSKNSSGKFQMENWSEKNEEELSSRVNVSVLDFPLDLSSVSNTDDSDENCETTNRGGSSLGKSKSSSAIPSEREGSESSHVHGCVVRNRNRSSPDLYETQKNDNDLVNVYIKTLNKQKDLVRFFRTCRTCNELCCVCPLLPSCSELYSFENPPERSANNALGETSTFEGIEGNESRSQFLFECGSCCILREVNSHRYSCPETFENDFFSSICGKECGCRINSSDSDRILAYTSTLASAARSARILARDLEFVLSALNNESEGTRRGHP